MMGQEKVPRGKSYFLFLGKFVLGIESSELEIRYYPNHAKRLHSICISYFSRWKEVSYIMSSFPTTISPPRFKTNE